MAWYKVLTSCIALQLGGSWGANRVGHEAQGAATKDQNLNTFKCNNCTDKVDLHPKSVSLPSVPFRV